MNFIPIMPASAEWATLVFGYAPLLWAVVVTTMWLYHIFFARPNVPATSGSMATSGSIIGQHKGGAFGFRWNSIRDLCALFTLRTRPSDPHTAVVLWAGKTAAVTESAAPCGKERDAFSSNGFSTDPVVEHSDDPVFSQTPAFRVSPFGPFGRAPAYVHSQAPSNIGTDTSSLIATPSLFVPSVGPSTKWVDGVPAFGPALSAVNSGYTGTPVVRARRGKPLKRENAVPDLSILKGKDHQLEQKAGRLV